MLLVGHHAVGGKGRHADRSDQLIDPQRRRPEVDEQLLGGNGALAIWPGCHNLCTEREHHRCQVRRRVGMGESATDRAMGPYLGVTDSPYGIGDDRIVFGDAVGIPHVVVRRERTKGHSVGEVHALELIEAADIDQHAGRRKAKLHGGNQGMATGEYFGIGVLAKNGNRIGDALGTMVGKGGRVHP